ncbi:MAG: hypothetical protein E2600_05355 [Chryseobacterium sp.]|nr:hypothetical protein [Chryseobacterium sp.]
MKKKKVFLNLKIIFPNLKSPFHQIIFYSLTVSLLLVFSILLFLEIKNSKQIGAKFWQDGDHALWNSTGALNGVKAGTWPVGVPSTYDKYITIK